MKKTNLDDQSLTWGELSHLFYNLDPARLACRENECTDEYDDIAYAAVAKAKHKQMSQYQSLVNELTWAFGCEPDEPLLKRLNAAYADAKTEALKRREKVIQSLHVKLFPEDYDHIMDSSSEAADRKRGKDPMSEEYRERWKAKRRRLVLTPELYSPDTMQFTGRVYECLAWYEVEDLLEQKEVDWQWVLAKILA